MKAIRCGERRYSPGKVVCVGKNYTDHIKEMGGRANDRPEVPTIFMKPSTSVVSGEEAVFIPLELGLLHHEVELCFVIGKDCKDVPAGEAPSFIAGYGVGIDFTLRDMQAAAKKAGGPWALSKGFDSSAVFGEFAPAGDVADPCALAISLAIDGKVKQDGSTREMIFSPAAILAYVSRFMTLEEGDVLMTGTPAGVGEVKHGDAIEALVEGLPALRFAVLRHRSAC